jgi:hypothetical protein
LLRTFNLSICLTALLPTVLFIGADNSKINNLIIDEDDCTCNGFKLYGKIQFVESFADVKVEVVESFPDLKVKIVDSFPDDCGEWQIVDSFPDLKVQIVESFADIKIKFVESFPGLP